MVSCKLISWKVLPVIANIPWCISFDSEVRGIIPGEQNCIILKLEKLRFSYRLYCGIMYMRIDDEAIFIKSTVQGIKMKVKSISINE